MHAIVDEKQWIERYFDGCGLSERGLERLSRASSVVHWRPREKYEFSPQNNPRKVFFLLEGTVISGCKVVENRFAYRHLISAGQWVGEIGVMEPEFPPFFAMAAQAATLMEIEADDLRKIMMDEPLFNYQLITRCAQRMNRLQARQQAMLTQSSHDRILAFLCEFALGHGLRQGGEMEVPNFLNHNDIARFTATSRQSVNTLLTRLRREGQLDYNEEQILIPGDKLSQWQLGFQSRFPYFSELGVTAVV